MSSLNQISFALWLFTLISYPSGALASLEVVNGKEVVPHSLPYMAFLEGEINGRSVRCGGSLVNNHQVLTAASCVYGAKNVTIILGAHNVEQAEDTQLRLQSSDFIIHNEYDADKHLNDIALINLATNVTLTDSISTINTPPLEDILETFADTLGEVAGWGKYNDTESAYSPVLRQIKATIIPYLSCTLSYLGQIKLSQICTTGTQEAQNICLGDAGSPLIVNGTQVGIASYGSGLGCAVGFPGVHTRLTSFYFWLSENVK